MVNKRGIVRIIEAVIAILIIFGVLLVVAQTRTIRMELDLTNQIPPLLDELAKDVTLRKRIVEDYDANLPSSNPTNAGVIDDVEIFLRNRITNTRIGFEVAICDASSICSLDTFPDVESDVFAGERIISATLRDFEPKKVKLFLWIE